MFCIVSFTNSCDKYIIYLEHSLIASLCYVSENLILVIALGISIPTTILILVVIIVCLCRHRKSHKEDNQSENR